MSNIQHNADEHEMSEEKFEQLREMADDNTNEWNVDALIDAMRDLFKYADYLRGELALAEGREHVLIEMDDKHVAALKAIVAADDDEHLTRLTYAIGDARKLVRCMGNDPCAYVKAVKS